ncbi:MAG: hypothetical protein ACTHWA_09470 [Arachnia sp.]
MPWTWDGLGEEGLEVVGERKYFVIGKVVRLLSVVAEVAAVASA